jgi:Flp pilus assembly protein TadD
MQGLLILSLTLFIGSSVSAQAGEHTDKLIQQSFQQTQAGRLEDALRTLQQAVGEDPQSALAHTRLGGVQILRQEYGAGIRSFQQAIMLDQTNAAAFIGMAVAYLHLGQYNLAKAALNEAGKLDPAKQPEIEKILAWINQRSEKAITSLH